MTADELNALEKEVSKAKFILSQKASILHDIIEDELPAGFEKIPASAEDTYKACQKWNELNQKLQAAKKEA